jgi:succinate dehydrogenase flavin-adding protein (antitoxin of CptAB toxin-antitoxin module)
MPDFIFKANVDRYRRLLASETDARKIATLRKLLEEEEAKLASWLASNPPPKASE